MNRRLRAQLRAQVDEREQMLIDCVHSALADQTHEVNALVGCDGLLDLLDPGAIAEEASVLDRFVDANEILHHDPAGPEVEVTDLTVADLTRWKAHGEARGLEQSARVTGPEPVPGRRRRHCDRISLAFSPVSPPIENYQDH